MISHKYRFIYIHIPKAAGTTIEGLSNIYDGVHNWNTRDRENGKDALPYRPMRRGNLARTLNAFPNYYVFTFVRDPLDRAISAYLHSQRRQRRPQSNPPPNVLGMTFQEYTARIRMIHVEGARVKDVGLSAFDSYHTKPQIFFMAQAGEDFFGVKLAEEVTLDFIGRVERFNHDMRQVLIALGLSPHTQLVHERYANSASRKDSLLTKAAVENIKEIYAADYSRLEYDLHVPLSAT